MTKLAVRMTKATTTEGRLRALRKFYERDDVRPVAGQLYVSPYKGAHGFCMVGALNATAADKPEVRQALQAAAEELGLTGVFSQTIVGINDKNMPSRVGDRKAFMFKWLDAAIRVARRRK